MCRWASVYITADWEVTMYKPPSMHVSQKNLVVQTFCLLQQMADNHRGRTHHTFKSWLAAALLVKTLFFVAGNGKQPLGIPGNGKQPLGICIQVIFKEICPPKHSFSVETTVDKGQQAICHSTLFFLSAHKSSQFHEYTPRYGCFVEKVFQLKPAE